MTPDEIRAMNLWQRHFAEIMLREIALQLIEIHQLLTDRLEPRPAGPADYERTRLGSTTAQPKTQHAKGQHAKMHK